MVDARTFLVRRADGSFCSVWIHRSLIAQMVQREVVGRYRGSVLGLLWSFLNPLFMLTVYTFVFSIVFNARWGLGGEKLRLTSH